MNVGAPNTRSNWFLSAWTRPTTVVVLALSLAFTAGREASGWQSGTGGHAPEVAEDVVSSASPKQAALSAAGTDGRHVIEIRRLARAPAQYFCGICVPFWDSNTHVAYTNPFPQATYGEGDHGWHVKRMDDTWCDILHGLCVSVPKGGRGLAQADAEGVTDAIAQAATEQDVALLATLLQRPDVHINSARGAIQVTGCDGTTIAGHVLVAPGLVAAAEVLAAEATESES